MYGSGTLFPRQSVVSTANSTRSAPAQYLLFFRTGAFGNVQLFRVKRRELAQPQPFAECPQVSAQAHQRLFTQSSSEGFVHHRLQHLLVQVRYLLFAEVGLYPWSASGSR